MTDKRIEELDDKYSDVFNNVDTIIASQDPMYQGKTVEEKEAIARYNASLTHIIQTLGSAPGQ